MEDFIASFSGYLTDPYLSGLVMKMRDYVLEKNIQNAIDSGFNVWVIGDVHGYYNTLELLLKNLKLKSDDVVILLGDLIDRGPRSAHVVKYARESENTHTVRGNHEQMMIDGFDEKLFFKDSNIDSRIWYHNGGINTEASYIRLYGGEERASEEAGKDVKWMEQLVTEIVLDDWRIVHGGYDQNHDVEGQGSDVHMYVRKQFYTSKKAIDPKRTILFGHTVTFKHLHKDDSMAGLIWESDVKLDDNRPMAIGMDTCLYHNYNLPRVLSAFNLQTREVMYQNRV
mgnify:CR=1 FL=1